MSTSQGLGRRRPGLFAFQPWTNLWSTNDISRQLAEELYFGGFPPAPVQIPLSWLRPDAATFRFDTPLDVAQVSQFAGRPAFSRNQAVITANNGREWPYTATLDTVVSADPGSLASWVTTYYDEPRPRGNALVLRLNARTEVEIQQILGVTQGRRITITGAPSNWPTGATDLVVEGIKHSISNDARDVTWSTSPVIGAAVGQVGPWFYTEDSFTTGTDVVPF